MNEDGSRLGIAIALVVCLLGATVILGWHLGNRALLQIHPSFAPMQYNTALGFLLVGGGLLAWEFARRRWVQICGLLGALIGGLTLWEYLAAINLGIDELLMTHGVMVETSHPGRMAPNTAVCLLLSGVSLMFLARAESSRFQGVSVAVVGALVTGLAAVALFGYLSRMETAYGWGNLTRMALHTSAGYLLAGHALMWIAWRLAPKDDTQMPLWAPFLPIAFGVTATVCICQAMMASDTRQVHRETKTAATALADLILNGLATRLEALGRMGTRWENNGGTPRPIWERDAQQYLHHTPSYRAIEWADTNNRVQWIMPLEGNEDALGLNLSQEEKRRAALTQARRTGETALSAPVDLVQAGKGFLAIVPLHIGNRFAGYIVGVFDVQILLASLLGDLGEDYAVELSADGETFFQHDELPAQHWKRWGTESALEFSGVEWRLRLAPTREHLAQEKSTAPAVIVIVGVIWSLLLSGVIAMYQRSRRQQGATERANLRFEQVVESSPTGILIIDHAGNISFANQRAEEIFGYADGDLTGRPVEELVPHAQRGGHVQSRHQFEAQGEARLMGQSRELSGVRRDGLEVPLEIGLAPIDTEAGKQVVASVFDVTLRREAEELQRTIKVKLEEQVEARTGELKRVNQELEQRSAALENSNRDLESFAYVASHDLQEPLRKIRAFGDVLREDIGADGGEDALESLEVITSSAERMSELIDALLAFSRVSHGAVSEDDVDLNEVMRDVLSDLQLPIENIKAEIRVPTLSRVRGDTAQLRSLFQNLVGNALKYHRPDAPLVVDITSEQIAEHETGRTVLRVHVRDTGKGFDESQVEKIFKPFQRLEGRASKTPGAGIGLAICLRIAERHHGTITARGEPGAGAEFVVTLPAARQT